MTERVINNQGIKILLERMDSNPDEFVQGAPDLPLPPKWRNIIAEIIDRVKTMGIETTIVPSYTIPKYTPLPFLSDDEVLAVYEKLNLIRGDLFTKQIMSTLLQENDDWGSELSSPQRTQGASGHSQPLYLKTRETVYDQLQKEYKKYAANNTGL